MRKKCVRWTKCVLAGVITAALMPALLDLDAAAQTSDPSALPRLAFSDLSYVGGFRLPANMANGDSFSFGGRQLAFNPAGPSLFVGSRAGRVAEVSIPSPVNSSNPAALPFATFLQPFADPTEGRLGQVAADGVGLDGLMVYGDRLYGTASIYYDANNTQRVSHYARSLRLDEASFSGWSQVWDPARSGFVSGAMAAVPAEWRDRLGGPAVTGQCCIPVVWRTSWGPSAFAFDPAQVGRAEVPASPLVYYTGEHPTLGQWDNSNPTYGATITMGGMVIVPGTRTALYFGANGTGPNCYGNGTGDQSLHGTKAADGSTWCYDPTNSDKGSHAYPYRYQIWAYDLAEFAEVKAGRKQPWDVVPYGVWPFDLPTPEPGVRLGGVGYDPATSTIYLSQLHADRDGYAYRPVIHVLHVNAPGRVEEAPAPTTKTVTRVSGVSIAADRSAPQAAGTPITWTATPVGGDAPHQYQWWEFDGVTWTSAGGWTTSASFAWTPKAAADYRVAVWARSAGSSEIYEATTEAWFAITGQAAAPPVSPRATAVRITANRAAPQRPGSTITWTAEPAGGVAPHQYQWWVFDGVTWIAQPWTTASTFQWTPASANANYRVAVWVRSAGNSGLHETSTEAWFAITDSVTP